MPGNGRPLSARAYAKLNLTLQILHKRPDGYHEIESLVQRIDLCDTVTLRPLDPGEEDRVICEPPVFIPAGKKGNTVCEALGARTVGIIGMRIPCGYGARRASGSLRC
jgi:4-diphosphocytidyl-2-C-methyl-D-erythritol kinase (EC 2.7.1.148)